MRIALVVVAAAVLAGVAGAQPGPHDFDITLTTDVPRVGAVPKCSPADANGVSSCTAQGKVSQAGFAVSGTGRERSTGRAATWTASCDVTMDFRTAFTVVNQPFDLKLTELGGTTSETCSWRVQTAQGSVVGTLRGGGDLTLTGPLTALFSASTAVSIAGGTGEFTGLVGGGSFEHRQEFNLLQAVGTKGLRETRPVSVLRLVLRKGAARVLIQRATAKDGLRVVAQPGSTCSAVAARAGKRVSLGKAGDPNRDGLVVIARKLRLAKGVWRVTVTCGGASASAAARI